MYKEQFMAGSYALISLCGIVYVEWLFVGHTRSDSPIQILRI